jgi:signal transduction histidine kinase
MTRAPRGDAPAPGALASGARRCDRLRRALRRVTERHGRGGRVRRPRSTIALGVGLSLVVIALESAPDIRTTHAVATAAIDSLMGLTFVWAGVVGLALRPRTPLGPAMMAVGVTSAFGNLVFAESVPVAYTVGLLSIGLFTAPLSHVLLAYPEGRLRTRADRVLVGLTYGHVTVQWWVFATFHDPVAAGCDRCGPDTNLIAIAPDGGVDDVLVLVQTGVSVVLAVFVVRSLRRRWIAASAVGRSLLGPVLFAGTFCASIVALTVPFAYDTVNGTTASVALHAAWLIAFGAIPVGYCAGLVRDAVRRARLAALLAELRSTTEPADLRRAVRAALGDADADIVRPGRDGATAAAAAGPAQARWPLGEGAVLTHDPALLQDEELVPAVGRAVALALENRRLRDELLGRLAELASARARLVRAGDETRRAIERDLHDGVQQTLVSLRLNLRLIDESRLDPESAEVLDEARSLARAATQEVRDLAHGVYPAVLAADGLGGGLRALAERAPVEVRLALDIPTRSLAELETAAYFCAREAVTNVAKHSGVAECACEARVSGGRLVLVVRDEGRGGAVVARGLRGLADRAEAAGGDLQVDSPPGGPTRVTVRLPWPASGGAPTPVERSASAR